MAPDPLGPLWPKIRRRLLGYKNECVQLLRELTAIPALGPENGGEGEQAKALYLQKKLKALNPQRMISLPCPDHRVPSKNRPNLLALFAGRDPRRTVWILSHLDTVPPGDRRLWKSDPYTLQQQGDRLVGRGVEDNHHGIVSSYLAVKAFQEEGVLPAYTIGVVLVSDEETGSRRGVQYVLKKQAKLFKPEDLIIVPDAGNPEGTLIEVAEKSLLWLKFSLFGTSCHASRPDLGVNTLRASAQLILALEQLPRRFKQRDRTFEPPISTFEPTKKEANVLNVNTIPGEDVFYLDCRVLPVYSLKQVLERVQVIVSAVSRKTGARITYEVVNAVQAPPPTSNQAPVVRALQEAVRAVYRKEACARGIGGATVAAFFRARRLPAAVWMTTLETAHQPNETARLSRMIGDAQVLAHIFCHPVA
jgi:succinyl-diaminopimelate desuccinylase